MSRLLAAVGGLVLLLTLTPPATAAPTELGRQTLAANDGWGGGTTGGAADPRPVVVSTRRQLVDAVAGSAPKIVYVRGTIRDDAGCAAYADPGYTLAGYLAAYDPAVWGRTAEPSGPLEEARVRSAAAQAAQIKIPVGSNTTIVGLGRNARLLGLSLVLDGVSNVIVRNLRFEDAADCFPQWDPTDGATGNWNSAYDNLQLLGASRVWVDHNTFTDGANPDSEQPVYFGRPYQVHDGQFDITRGSDLVTGSWNVFARHDKVSLIGSTNNPADDRGKLRVTLHHNRYTDVLQRLPRVRFGPVHVYNNLYEIPAADPFEYALGVGVESAIVAERNAFLLGAGVPAGDLLYHWGGTALTARDNTVNGAPVDLVAAYNAAHDPDLGNDAGWTPTRVGRVDPVARVAAVVRAGAGAGRL
ncbi:pectate lyase family protein [Cryptosporangium aurantiacum]|uniref:Pectate lyase n=1 Tax=Cryptosporangium aurantiacum TaxID=134849 RepID=A0A1M7RNU0_9ACTN|nr:polysaccharide lyase family 1 protein [Cryptosporangium aurantiacum]SHN47762.1 pectate lyase [Cryptosporangium aurantiacum]